MFDSLSPIVVVIVDATTRSYLLLDYLTLTTSKFSHHNTSIDTYGFYVSKTMTQPPITSRLSRLPASVLKRVSNSDQTNCDGVGTFTCDLGTCYTGRDGFVGCCSVYGKVPLPMYPC